MKPFFSMLTREGGGSLPSKKTEKYSVSLSIGSHEIEGAVFNHEQNAVIKSVVHKLPAGLVVSGGDVLSNAQALGDLFMSIMQDLDAPTRKVQLSIPCTLMRLMEVPKMEAEEYYVFLASEAERFRAFDNTEAVVAFNELPSASHTANQRLLYTAVRRDSFLRYRQAAQLAKIQLLSIHVEPLQVLRGSFAKGVLHSRLIEVEHPDTLCWGSILHEFDRLRFLIWQGKELIDIREVTMSEQMLANPNEQALVLSDLLMELKRTVANLKTIEPQFWLTHHLNYVLLQHLQHETGKAFQCFELPTSIQVDRADLGMAVLGGCLTDAHPEPYLLNFLDKKAPYHKENMSFSSPFDGFTWSNLDALNFSQQVFATTLLPFVFGSIGVVMVAWITLMVVNQYTENDTTQTNEAKASLEDKVAQLKSQIDYYQQVYRLSEKVLSVANASKSVNILLLGLLSDIQHLPASLWFNEVGYDKQISITGNALKPEDILDLTHQLEQRRYGRDFVLHYIREEDVGDDAPLIYSFMLGGFLNAEETPVADEILPQKTEPVKDPETSTRNEASPPEEENP